MRIETAVTVPITRVVEAAAAFPRAIDDRVDLLSDGAMAAPLAGVADACNEVIKRIPAPATIAKTMVFILSSSRRCAPPNRSVLDRRWAQGPKLIQFPHLQKGWRPVMAHRIGPPAGALSGQVPP
jgi:hypothetical protein